MPHAPKSLSLRSNTAVLIGRLLARKPHSLVSRGPCNPQPLIGPSVSPTPILCTIIFWPKQSKPHSLRTPDRAYARRKNPLTSPQATCCRSNARQNPRRIECHSPNSLLEHTKKVTKEVSEKKTQMWSFVYAAIPRDVVCGAVNFMPLSAPGSRSRARGRHRCAVKIQAFLEH